MLRGGRIGGVGTRSGKEEGKFTVTPAWQFDLLPLTHRQGKSALWWQSLQKPSVLISELGSSELDTGPALFSEMEA